MHPELLIPVVVAVAFALLRWLVPAKKTVDDGPPLTDEERAVFRRWELAAVGLFVLFAVALGFLWFGAFEILAALLLSQGPGAAFLFAPDTESLGIPAVFLGVVTSLLATELFLRAALRERHARFERYSREKATFDAGKVAVGLGWGVAVAVLVFLGYWASSVTRIGSGGIELGSGWPLGRERIPYERVRAVQLRASFRAPNGNLIARPHHAIVFDDGREWTTRGPLRAPIPEADAQAMAFAARRAGLSIEQVP